MLLSFFCGEGRSLLNRAESCRDSPRMDESQYPNDFSPLTIEQIHELSAAVRETFDGKLSRAAFTASLLLLIEDVPGFEMGEIPASLIDAAWATYNQSASPSK